MLIHVANFVQSAENGIIISLPKPSLRIGKRKASEESDRNNPADPPLRRLRRTRPGTESSKDSAEEPENDNTADESDEESHDWGNDVWEGLTAPEALVDAEEGASDAPRDISREIGHDSDDPDSEEPEAPPKETGTRSTASPMAPQSSAPRSTPEPTLRSYPLTPCPSSPATPVPMETSKAPAKWRYNKYKTHTPPPQSKGGPGAESPAMGTRNYTTRRPVIWSPDRRAKKESRPMLFGKSSRVSSADVPRGSGNKGRG